MDRVKGQAELRRKVQTVAVAYNNHYSAQAVVNAIHNMRLIAQPDFLAQLGL